MQKLFSFLQLIRWKNIFIIALSQFVFQYFVYYAILDFDFGIDINFIFLVLASVCIAAAGYIINDYFDIDIDRINKPQHLILDNIINRRVAIVWHQILNLLGVVFSFMAFNEKSQWWLILVNCIVMLLLWIYSTSLKKQFLIGNVVIATLSAWTLLVVYFYNTTKSNYYEFENYLKVVRITILYVAFSFIISLIREIIKDIQDFEGDKKYHCKTMPIVWGIFPVKIFTFGWLFILFALVAIVEFYIFQFRWWWMIIYFTLALLIPLLFFAKKFWTAQSKNEFRFLSDWAKWMMLAGILSMLFFKLYIGSAVV